MVTTRFTSDGDGDGDGAPAHCTGGAVDVVLFDNGKPAVLGTTSDRHSVENAADWYDRHPPKNHFEVIAAENRFRLDAAMQFAGFIQSKMDFRHFEYGTVEWARLRSEVAFLDCVLKSVA